MPIAVCERCDKYYLTTAGDSRHRRCPECAHLLRVATRDQLFAHLRRSKPHLEESDPPSALEQ